MIGYNESPNKKAKFWQSYIRSLKGKSQKTNRRLLECSVVFSIGSEDIRANEGREDYHRTGFSIYDEPSTANGRITSPGYRYLPVHRETYGYSPRAIYQHQTQRPGKKVLTSLVTINNAQNSSEHQPCSTQRSTSLGRPCRSHEGVGTQISITLWLVS